MYWLGAENLLALTAFKNMLLLKAYSPATIKNYMNEFHQLLRLLGNRSVNSLGKEQVMGRGKEFYDLPRPKKPWKLPSVFAEEEVMDIIGEIKNIKHKVMIMAGYSAGLRVSEIVGS